MSHSQSNSAPDLISIIFYKVFSLQQSHPPRLKSQLSSEIKLAKMMSSSSSTSSTSPDFMSPLPRKPNPTHSTPVQSLSLSPRWVGTSISTLSDSTPAPINGSSSSTKVVFESSSFHNQSSLLLRGIPVPGQPVENLFDVFDNDPSPQGFLRYNAFMNKHFGKTYGRSFPKMTVGGRRADPPQFPSGGAVTPPSYDWNGCFDL